MKFVIAKIRHNKYPQKCQWKYRLPAKPVHDCVRDGGSDKINAKASIRPFLVTPFEGRNSQHQHADDFENHKQNSKIIGIAQMPDAVYSHLRMRGERSQNAFKEKNDTGCEPVDDGESFCVHNEKCVELKNSFYDFFELKTTEMLRHRFKPCVCHSRAGVMALS